MHRFSAKLLFQFRVEIRGAPGKRRTCEERIVSFRARSPREALSRAKRRGTKAEFSYLNDQGNRVRFQFVGVMDLMSLGLEAGPDEFWYDIRERLLPMERRDQILATEGELLNRLEWMR